MSNPLLAKLKSGGCVSSFWSALGTPSIAELLALAGADSIVFDLQHGLWLRPQLEAAIGLTRDRAVPICRVADHGFAGIGAALDAGARGVIVPMVETPEQAAAIVAAAKYPPQGRRSTGGIRPIIDDKTYVPRANDDIVVAAMIETATGTEAAAAIAAVPGIDALFIGPYDLSLSLGTFPDFGPRHEAAVLAILAAARKAGKPCGIFTPYASVAAHRRAQGFQWVVLADDQNLIHRQAIGAAKKFRGGEGPDLLAGGVALVTGANRGLGAAIIAALGKAGIRKIYAAARKPDTIAGAKSAGAPELIPLPLDVTDPASVAAAAAAAPDVTLLVNNAGINFNAGIGAAQAFAQAEAEMAVNYFGAMRMALAFRPILAAHKGALVNVATILAHLNLPMMGTYCASKAALLSLTQALRAEWKSEGVHVMAVLPGAIDTEMTRDFQGPKMPAADVAAAIVEGLRRRAEDIYPGAMASGIAIGLAYDPKGTEDEFAAFR